jgi:CBS domain-containing protein
VISSSHPDRPSAESGNGTFSQHGDRLAGLRVLDLMSDEPVIVQPDWSLLRSLRIMIVSGVNRLPAVDRHGGRSAS